MLVLYKTTHVILMGTFLKREWYDDEALEPRARRAPTVQLQPIIGNNTFNQVQLFGA